MALFNPNARKNLPQDTIRYVVDVETSGVRKGGFHSFTGAAIEPRITQVAAKRIENAGSIIAETWLSGGGGDASKGYTSLLDDLIRKHNIRSISNIPIGFWQDCLSLYNPSVLERGSLLNKQIMRHLEMALAEPGRLKGSDIIIKDLINKISVDIAAGKTVEFVAYNKDFDISQILTELRLADPTNFTGISNNLKGAIQTGKLKIMAGEEAVMFGIFERMMQDPTATPVFSKSKAFDIAFAAKLRPDQLTGKAALVKDFAKREYFNALREMWLSGRTADQVFAGLSDELRGLFKNIKTGMSLTTMYEEFKKISEKVEADSRLKEEFTSFFRNLVQQKHGEGLAAHVRSPHLLHMILGWRQESLAKRLFGMAIEHEAYSDIPATEALYAGEKGTINAAVDLILKDERYQEELVQETYAKWLRDQLGGKKAESIIASQKLTQQSISGATRGLYNKGVIATSPLNLNSTLWRRLGNKIPARLAAWGGVAAGALWATSQLSGAIDKANRISGIEEQIGQRIASLRDGIIVPKLSRLPMQESGVTSWENYRGISVQPEVIEARQWFARPDVQRKMVRSSDVQISAGASFTDEEMASGKISLGDYIYKASDADSLTLHRAVVNTRIPVIGPMAGWIQKKLTGLVERVSGQQLGIQVRLHGIDAPETKHYGKLGQPHAEESKEMLEDLMTRWGEIRLTGGGSYGRHSGTIISSSGKDINRELVNLGGAMELEYGEERPGYLGAETAARLSQSGIWKEPFFQGIKNAQMLGVNATLSDVSSPKSLATKAMPGVALSSAMMNVNYQRSKTRDSRAQTFHLFPNMSQRGYNNTRYNTGSLER